MVGDPGPGCGRRLLRRGVGGQGDPHGGGHRPVKRGGRFSRKAARPSRKSSLRDDSSRARASFCSWSSRGAVLPACEQPLGEAEGDGRPAGEALDDRARPRRRARPAGTARVDQAPVGGLGARQLAAEQQQLPGPHGRRPPGAAARWRRVGREAPLGERLPEPGVLGDDGEVGGHRELQADARGPALHPAHDRHLHVEHQGDQAVGQRRHPPLDAAHPGPLGLLGRRRPGRAGVAGHDVGAAAEVVAGAGEHDARARARRARRRRGRRPARPPSCRRGRCAWPAGRAPAGGPRRRAPPPGRRPGGTPPLIGRPKPSRRRTRRRWRRARRAGRWRRPAARAAAPAPCSRLGSRIVAWPGVVTSPRWFSATRSRSTAGRSPSARYFRVTVPRSHWVSPT